MPSNASTNLLVNREAPPFDSPDLRRALALALDRKSFIDILAEGQGDIGGAMLPPPAGLWGMPPEVLSSVAGYDPDVAKSREAAREIMKRLGYGPEKRRDQSRRAQHRGLSRSGDHPDRPAETDRDRERVRPGRDRQLVRQARPQGLPDWPQQHRQRCGRSRPAILRELRLRLGAQLYRLLQRPAGGTVCRESEIADREKRRRLVWGIDKQLQEDGARPIIYHTRVATCMLPQVKGLTIMVNSQCNRWRMEDVWLGR